MKMIINADDFGINNSVTEAIKDCIDRSLISSTTVVANGTCLADAKAFADKHPEISFGIHYCLSEFESLTKSSIFFDYGLMDKQGVFIKKAIFKINKLDQVLRKALYEELCAQTDRLLYLGFEISHADSHHHVHTLPILQDIFIDVLKKYDIRKIRIPRSYRVLSAIRHPMSYIVYRHLLNKYKRHFVTTSLFSSYKEFVLKCKNADTIELMCHPGHPGPSYKAEIDLLYKKSIDPNLNYQMISYDNL